MKYDMFGGTLTTLANHRVKRGRANIDTIAV